MSLTDQQKRLDQSYLKHFGRTADHTTAGGSKYWLDKYNPQTDADWKEIDRMLGGSGEADSFKKTGVVRPGGVNRDTSTYKQSDNEYLKSIRNLNQDSSNILNTIAANTFLAGDDGKATTDNVKGGYFQISDQELLDLTGGGGGGDNDDDGGSTIDTSGFLTANDLDAWWDKLDKPWETKKSEGMDDFMKFMMLMSVMGGGRGMGGGGYGGSQYGYGGLNPGGVQSAYDPWAGMTKGWNFMKEAFGSGSSNNDATTQTINAT